MPPREDVDRLDWYILNALADDYESVEQIQKLIEPMIATQEEIIERLARLYQAGYVFLTLDAVFDRAALLSEISETKSRAFWFGYTGIGRQAWRALADRYCAEVS